MPSHHQLAADLAAARYDLNQLDRLLRQTRDERDLYLSCLENVFAVAPNWDAAWDLAAPLLPDPHTPTATRPDSMRDMPR